MNNSILIFLLSFSLLSCLITKSNSHINTESATSISDFFEIKATPQDSVLSNKIILSGHLFDFETKEALIFASIAIYKNDVLIASIESDFDGYFSYKMVRPSEHSCYRIECSYLGFNTLVIEDVNLIIGCNYEFKVALEVEDIDLSSHPCRSYHIPLIKMDNTTSGQTITSDQIRRRAARG